MFTLICGISRAGKTTFSKLFDNVIHLDDYINSKNCYDNVIKDIHNGIICDGVTLEGCYNKATKRVELIKNIRSDYYRCIWLNTSKEKIKSRTVYVYMSFEQPTLEEGWDEIQIINDNEIIILEKERKL